MKAIIVVGQSGEGNLFSSSTNRFWRKCQIVVAALTGALCFDKKDIFIFRPDGLAGSGEKLRKDLESLFMENSDEDICLFYIGHGQKNGWAPSARLNIETLTYRQLSLIFACHSGNLIFVNYCCYAGAARYSLIHHPGEHLLIAAMPKNISGIAFNFCRTVMDQWANEKFFDPHISLDNENFIPSVEGNESLQSRMFSKRRSLI